jgi:hypothetical protein
VRALRRLAFALFGAAALAGAAGGVAAWLSPTLRELALLAGLASGVRPIQAAAAEALADHPSDRAALGLVAFVNLLYRPPIDDDWEEVLLEPDEAPDARVAALAARLESFGCLPDRTGAEGLRGLSEAGRRDAAGCAAEVLRRHEAERVRDAELAERGLLSLCILSGHAFGTYYEPNEWGGYTWGSLSDERWRVAIAELDAWAFETFGQEQVAELAGAALEAMGTALALEEPAP